MLGLASLAVDFGRVETIKQDLQRCADASAPAAVNAYATSGYNQTTAGVAASSVAASNPVDAGSGISPTVTFVGGTWNLSTRTFSSSYAPGVPAVMVTASRLGTTGNAVPLTFGKAIGISAVNVKATAIAALIDNDAAPVVIPATANLYFSGMPAGTTSPWGDSSITQGAYRVVGIDVVPGTWISFTNPLGMTNICPGYLSSYGPAGDTTRLLHHGENQDHTDMNIGPENGIADAIIPACAMTGLFLTDSAPTSRVAPPTVDWSNATIKDQPTYANLTLQAPFMVGNGKTTSGTVKKFQVPPGATRLYMSIWDGVGQANDTGQLTATINLNRSVRLVK